MAGDVVDLASRRPTPPAPADPPFCWCRPDDGYMCPPHQVLAAFLLLEDGPQSLMVDMAKTVLAEVIRECLPRNEWPDGAEL